MGHTLLPGGSNRGLAQNRRRGKRHRLDIPATLIADQTASRPLAVKITEFSIHGLGIRGGTSLAAGEIYEVRAFDTLVPPGMRVKIVSCRPMPEGGFAIGSEVV